MMTSKLIKLVKSFLLFLSISTTFAYADEGIQQVPAFAGGLNAQQISACEEKYEKACPIVGAKTAAEGFIQQNPCIEKKLAADHSCAQASAIRKITAYAPTKIKQYGVVSIFNITTLADGIDVYYIVDEPGRLIQLTTQINLDQNKNYLTLKKQYPNIELTTFLYWTKLFEDLFPKPDMLPNNGMQLIFRQELRSPGCVACAVVGVAAVVYLFDPHGKFLRAELGDVTPVKPRS